MRSRLFPEVLLLVLAYAVLAKADPPSDPIASARDLNNNDGTNPTLGVGRLVGAAIDPTDPSRAYALAESGGFYGSTDGGFTWTSNVLEDGSPGPFGRGLASGLSSFAALALDPFIPRILLALVEDDTRASGSRSGIWRSSDGGETWSQAIGGLPPCRVSYNRGNLAHIRFSQDHEGEVWATSNCGLGLSTDHGASWEWVDPDPAHPGAGMDGLDLLPSSDTFDAVGMCLYEPSTSGPTGRSVAIYRRGLGTTLYDVPPQDATGVCAFAFNPNAVTDVFVSVAIRNPTCSPTDKSCSFPYSVFEGRLADPAPGISRLSATWSNLLPPDCGAGNGRAPVLQARPDTGNRFRLYFHNSTAYYQESCPQNGGCPVGSLGYAAACADPDGFACAALTSAGDPWSCISQVHSDFTELVFDPTRSDACPLLMPGDGGMQRLDCDTNEASMSSAGIHALQTYEAAFTGASASTQVYLASHDNGVEYSPDDGATWTRVSGGDGFSADAVRIAPDVATYTGNTTVQERLSSSTSFILPTPPNTPFQVVAQQGMWEPRFAWAHQLIVPTVTPAGDVQLEELFEQTDVSPASWGPFLEPLRATLLGVSFAGDGCCGDMAVGGRGGAPATRIVYLLTPPQPLPAGSIHKLFCHSGTTWRAATGLRDPVRVWASEADPTWAFAFDVADGNVYVTHDGACGFTKDPIASDLLDGLGRYGAVADPAGWQRSANVPLTGVGFDPGRPGRAALGTSHSGILVTSDSGKSWSVSHAFPEPNAGATAIYFDDSGLATGTLEETRVAAWGRGVWAVHFGAGSILVRVKTVPRVSGAFDVTARLHDESGRPLSGKRLAFALQGDIPAALLGQNQNVDPNLLPFLIDFLDLGAPVNPNQVPAPGPFFGNPQDQPPGTIEALQVGPQQRPPVATLLFTPDVLTDASGHLRFRIDAQLPHGTYVLDAIRPGDMLHATVVGRTELVPGARGQRGEEQGETE